MRRSVRVCLGLLCVVAVFVAGCGGDDDDSAGGGATTTQEPGGGDDDANGGEDGGGTGGGGEAPDPCALVSKDEVSEAYGSPMEDPELTDLDAPVGGKQCLLSNTDAPPIKQFSIVTRVSSDFSGPLEDQTVDKLFDDTRNFLGDNESGNAPEDITGLGDRAFKVGNNFYILKDGVYLEVSSGLTGGSEESEAAVRSLAEKAVSRL